MQKPHVIAVTGATGFIGCRLLQRLGEEGYRIRALTRRPIAAGEGIEWLHVGLDDPPGLDRLLEGADALIHRQPLLRQEQLREGFAIIDRGLDITDEAFEG